MPTFYFDIIGFYRYNQMNYYKFKQLIEFTTNQASISCFLIIMLYDWLLSLSIITDFNLK